MTYCLTKSSIIHHLFRPPAFLSLIAAVRVHHLSGLRHQPVPAGGENRQPAGHFPLERIPCRKSDTEKRTGGDEKSPTCCAHRQDEPLCSETVAALQVEPLPEIQDHPPPDRSQPIGPCKIATAGSLSLVLMFPGWPNKQARRTGHYINYQAVLANTGLGCEGLITTAIDLDVGVSLKSPTLPSGIKALASGK